MGPGRPSEGNRSGGIGGKNMIANQRQYRATKAQVRRLKGVLVSVRKTSTKMPQEIYAAMISGIKSQIAEMEAQVREYEALPTATGIPLESVDKMPEVLIKARIARGFTQKDLAVRVGIKPQQIQAYESSGYRSASWTRVTKILRALDIDLRERILLKPVRARHHAR